MSLIKKINDPNGKIYDDLSIGSLVLDTKPIPGSFNTITSDAVAKISGGVAELDAIVPEGASGENKLATAADVAGVQEDVDTIEGKIPSDTSTTNKLVNESGLQDAIDSASESWSTGFTPKGESSVSDLNDLATQSNGDSYIVTDSGTLTDGSLAVVAGDQVAWDATNSVWYKLPQYALASDVYFNRTVVEDRLVYKRLSDVTGVVQTTTSERASTPAFFVTPNSRIVVKCEGYQIRLTFWSSTAYSAGTILNASAPENVGWNNGSKGISTNVPSGAVCAMVSLRKSDNSSFETALPRVTIYFVETQRFVAGDYDSQKVVSSANGLVTLPQKVLVFDKKYCQSAFYVHVNVPSGKRARVIFGYVSTSATYYDVGTLIALDWITANDSVRLPIGANWFCVEFANSDGSAVNMADFKEAYCIGADTNFFGKRLSILGDSISTFGGSANDDPRYAQVGDPTYPGNRCRYPQNDLLTDVNLTYWYRIIHDFGMELGISESWAGSCVSNTQETDSGDLGPNRCMSSQTRINHLAYNGKPDIILVYGGTNDYGRQFPLGTFDYTNVNGWSDAQIAAMPNGTFAEAYKAMLTRIQKTYPNAKIYCITPNFTGGDMGRLDTYVEVVKEACDFFGVQCIDVRSVGINVFNKDSFLPDNLHPNANGMLLLAEKIRKAMLYA